MKQTGELQKARDALFTAALKECKSPEEAAVRLGVSVSTVMRFKRKQKQRRGRAA